MKIRLKRGEMFRLLRALESTGKIPSTRFAYAVARNKKLVQQEVDSLRAAIEPPAKLKEYDDQRRNLALKHARRTKDGQPDVDQAGHARIQDMQAFDHDIQELRASYKDDLEAYEKLVKEHDTFLGEEAEYDLYEIKMKDLPKELKGEDLEILIPILIGDPSELPE